MKLNKHTVTTLGSLFLTISLAAETLKAAPEIKDTLRRKAPANIEFSKEDDVGAMYEGQITKKRDVRWIKAEKKNRRIFVTGNNWIELCRNYELWRDQTGAKDDDLRLVWQDVGKNNFVEKYGRVEGKTFYVDKEKIHELLKDKEAQRKLEERNVTFRWSYDADPEKKIKIFAHTDFVPDGVTSILKTPDKVLATEKNKETAYDAKTGQKLWEYVPAEKFIKIYDYETLKWVAYWSYHNLKDPFEVTFKNIGEVKQKLNDWNVVYDIDGNGLLRTKWYNYDYEKWFEPGYSDFFKDNIMRSNIAFQNSQDAERLRNLFIETGFGSPGYNSFEA
ncbi:MAG: hypothetical protein JSS34_00985 [Proteobacteria bacterium]|nr:hypothetical protein [Pseudomonadota bacterium]